MENKTILKAQLFEALDKNDFSEAKRILAILENDLNDYEEFETKTEAVIKAETKPNIVEGLKASTKNYNQKIWNWLCDIGDRADDMFRLPEL